MPTRTEDTENNYRTRARQLVEAAAAGHAISPTKLADALVERRPALSPSSFRQYRSALIFAFTEAAKMRPDLAPQLRAGIAVLEAPAHPRGSSTNKVLRTSQQKQKGGELDDDLERICHAALATRSPNARRLADCLVAGSLAGARLVEWPTAFFGPSAVKGFEWELVLQNGKQGNGRGHGETRVLRWQSLPEHLICAMTAWISAAAEAAAKGSYAKLQSTLEALMRRETKRLFRGRKRRPTLSSARHAAAARWKQAYVAGPKTEEEKLRGLAVVAALLGHASDATATIHYARAREGRSQFPVPSPDRAEVARIRQRYSPAPFKSASLRPGEPE
jgi:hypothetical protein